MEFDFSKRYKEYSNIELLKIIKRPTDYQPHAVAVATQLLSQRQVTMEELEWVDLYFQDLESGSKVRKEKMEAYKTKAADLFEPVLRPSENMAPDKWLNLFLFVVALQYVWLLYNKVKGLQAFLQCHYCSLDVGLSYELLPIFYVPLIFYLLLKRKRWGWMLLFADNVFALVSCVFQFYVLFKYEAIHGGSIASLFFLVSIRLGFLLYLWRDPVAPHFNVDKKTKRNTLEMSPLVALLFVLTIYIIS